MIIMVVVGLNLLKISVEREELLKGKININNHMGVKGVEKKDFAFGKHKEPGLRFVFMYQTVYTEDKKVVGKVDIEGEALFMEQPEVVTKIYDDWKKEKKLPTVVMGQVLNAAMGKCNIKAIVLTDEVGLPSPVPMPKVSPKPKAGKKK